MAAATSTQHIGILYLKEGQDWANYLKSLFVKDERLELDVMLLNLGHEQKPADVISVTSSCLVTILLMTPDIMEWLTNINLLNSYLKVIPQHRELVGMSAFLDNSEYSEIQKACSASSKWTRMILTETASENTKMVADIIDLVEKVEKLEKPKQTPEPKKRTSLEKTRTPSDQDPPSTSFPPEVRDIFPSKIFTAREKVVIVFKEPVDGTIHVSFKGSNSGKHDTKKLNPYSFRFRTPVPVPSSNILEIFLDGKLIASKHLTFVKPTQSAFQSLGYIMQVLGVETTEELDQRLCDIFERSIPRDNSLKTLFSKEEIQLIINTSVQSKGDFPTMLHFAAAHGLSDFTSLLLELPGSLAAFNIENQNHHNPADMAASNRHDDLARYITEFTDTNAIVDACGIYVSMCDNDSDDLYMFMGGGNEGSLEDVYSKSLEDFHKSAPVIVPKEDDDAEPPPLPPARQVNLPPVPPQHRKLSLDSTNVPLNKFRMQRGTSPATTPTTPTRPKDFMCPKPLEFENPAAFLAAKEPKRKLSQGALGSSAQQELIDIQLLVKNKEFSIDEALMIYNSWKDRPTSQSFKDRKKNLEELKTTTNMLPTQPTNKSMLRKLLSFRTTKRRVKEQNMVPIVESIYDTYPIPKEFIVSPSSSLHRVSSLSNSSSSSGTSRESGVSLKETIEANSSDSESEDRTVRTRTNRSNFAANANKRKSKKDMYLEGIIYEKEVKLPPVPPRHRRASKSTQPPPQLPKPRGTR